MQRKTFETTGWDQTDAQIFWGEIAPTKHVLQIYEDENGFLDLLENFVVGGIRSGDSVIIIAIDSHIQAINERIISAGFDPFQLKLKDQYIPLDAEQMLSRFMVEEWPDELLFRYAVADVLSSAKRYNRQVRAFGEMVSILWQRGLKEQTVELEAQWNRFCETNDFILFCAYPKQIFSNDPQEAIHHVCCKHSHLITCAGTNSNDVLYKRV